MLRSRPGKSRCGASREVEIAVEAARIAGEILSKASRRLRALHTKDDPYEVLDSRKHFVTEVDLRCEAAIRRVLTAEFPRDGVLGEELKSKNVKAERVWVIDPLDGTLSYAQGLDSYVTAIGLIQNREGVLGVVYQPEKKEWFVAERGSGAYLNGKRIGVGRKCTLESSVVSLDHRIFRIEAYPRVVRDLVRTIRRLRVSESCSQELCYVACGRLDGFVRTLQPTYDYLMGKVIVEEAGGLVRDFEAQQVEVRLNRERNTNLLAGNEQIVSLLSGYLAEPAPVEKTPRQAHAPHHHGNT
jgi:myo-inositol-1(or 4)-monophosphatase